MLSSVAIVFPIFGLIAVGLAVRRFDILDDQMGESLSKFVFTLAIPALLFSTLSRSELPAVQPWGYWSAYFIGLAAVWFVAGILSRRLLGHSRAGAVVAGFTAGQGNLVLVGVPLVLSAYGEAAATPLFLLIGIHLPITMTAATLMLEGREASLLAILRKLARHPIILAIAAGWIARVSGLALPAPVWTMLEMLGSAAVPGALIATGVALHRYGLKSDWKMPAVISVLKLIVHPAIVYVLAFHVMALPPLWGATAVLLAACPTGINAYLLAQNYREGVALASGSVFLTTVLALATTVFWLAILPVP
ncbi:MAG TPA: AEC family transporter [Saliniramus sp.]|nr:AEC family transporter [Saliniramus sp.]